MHVSLTAIKRFSLREFKLGLLGVCLLMPCISAARAVYAHEFFWTPKPGMVLNTSSLSMLTIEDYRDPLDLDVVRVPNGCHPSYQPGQHLIRYTGVLHVVGRATDNRKRFLVRTACGTEMLASRQSLALIHDEDEHDRTMATRIAQTFANQQDLAARAAVRQQARLQQDAPEAASVPTPAAP